MVLAVVERGLTSVEAATRLARDGANVLPRPRPVPVWRSFLAELTHFFALLFWVAGALAIVGGMPELGVAVFAVVFINGAFAFVQERRAEHTAERLRSLLPRTVRVVRDDVEQSIDPESLVVGDLVVVAEGDRISADQRLVEARGLAIDDSSLTGESVPVHPGVGATVHAGCFVVEGEGRAVVVATGADTRLGVLASLSARRRTTPTPMRRELEHVSRIIAMLSVGVGVVFFGVALSLGTDPNDGFLFAVGVTVALVPEGLLPTVTLSLAMGAQQMAHRNALVRHLEAAETLGSVTFICTDKTGTLTRNEMTVREVWMPSGRVTIDGDGYGPTAEISISDGVDVHALADLALVAARCGSGRVVWDGGQWRPQGDPMEAALHSLALRTGSDPDIDRAERPDRIRFPFDARRRRMSVVLDDRIVVKGAPDAVVPMCGEMPGASEALHRMTSVGLRVLAIADRRSRSIPTDAATAESELDLLGLIGLEDPPRHGVRDAIEQCRRAGVGVAMVTGDHPGTARAVAVEVGLQSASEGEVLLGADLPDDDCELASLVDHDGLVIARVTPEQKLRIARALRDRGHVVGMTGDGVNDAPALREAAIGIAMGRSGTDVARDAADLVLLDDRFETIVDAVRQGRSTYSDIRRSLTYHLTANVAELAPFIVWALSGRRIPLALGVLQILALDIGADVLPALALGVEPPGEHVMEGRSTRRHLLDRRVFVRAFGVLGPTEAVMALTSFLLVLVTSAWRPGALDPSDAALLTASGAAFTTIVLGQAANAFACRSTVLPAWRVPVGRNRLLLVAMAVQLGLLVVFLSPPLGALLGQTHPSLLGVVCAVATIPVLLLIDALFKAQRRRTRSTISTFDDPAESVARRWRRRRGG
ncbi:MAG: cation-transporting P-type ATPase [Acidimicrobiia bacterium]|nr:cation-transporting P-type ATPase [Acidimicrobiia bacterium]